MIIVYGATGYTGSLVAQQLVAAGHRPVLAGRSKEALESIGRPLDLDMRVGGLSEPPLDGATVLLNCAGPFSVTQHPLLEACIAQGIHYLDLAGEVDEHQSARAKSAAARNAGTLVLPGVGFGIVPSEGLLAHVVQRLPKAARAELALKTVGAPSRGTAEVVLGNLRTPGVHRENGALQFRRPGQRTTKVDFLDGDGLTTVTTNPWRGDLASAAPSVKDLEASMALPAPLRMLMKVPHGGLLRAIAKRMPDGPTAEQRAAGKSAIHVRAEDADGRAASSVITGPDPYTFTALSAATAAAHVVRLADSGTVPVGYRLPSDVLGTDFVLELPGVSRWDSE